LYSQYSNIKVTDGNVTLMGKNISTIRKNTGTLLRDSSEIDVELNAGKT
jgi:hypothetical protein